MNSGIGSDLGLIALVFHWREEVEWDGTTLKDGFVSCDFPTTEMYSLSEEVVQAKKRVRGVVGVPKTPILTAIPVSFCAGVSRGDLASIEQDLVAYRRLKGNCGEAERAEASVGLGLDVVLEKDLSLAQTGDA